MEISHFMDIIFAFYFNSHEIHNDIFYGKEQNYEWPQ